jgi:hypothetical protein
MPENAILPEVYSPPFEVITPPRVGFLYNEEDCRFISVSRTRTAQHYNGYEWRSSREEKEYWTNVWVQSFCSKSGKQRWFIVSIEEGQTTADKAPIPDDVLAQKEAILLDFGKMRVERRL